MKRLLFILLLLVPCLAAQDLASFEQKVTVKVLPNGLTLILCQRPEAPVFSFYTHVDIGSVYDPKGETGLAHMFEHMAFKGTPTIGTKDWSREKVALAEVEKAYDAWRTERQKIVARDPKRIEAARAAFEQAVANAQQYVNEGEFDEILESNGAVGVNAETDYDETSYFYSMPSNRLELWAYLESDRFAHPVMREFYKERDVVMEERRMRVDSQPFGRLLEQFEAVAFVAHPYHRPTVGWMSDLEDFSATEALDFFRKNYVPAEMVIAVVGDVGPKDLPMLERYFGRLPKAPKPGPIRTIEPPQRTQRQVLLRDPSQPVYIEGYHRPDSLDPDDAVYTVLADLLTTGRTSRLYRALVRDKKIAAYAAGYNEFPGDKYPNIFGAYAVPLPGHNPQEMAMAIDAEIQRLKTQDVSDAELKMVKTRARASLIRSLASNPGLAEELAAYQARYGDWRQLFREIDEIDKVTAADIRRVANQTFRIENRTVGIIETQARPAAPPSAPPAEPSKQEQPQ
jgi:predicted Zn-dependent peptidase